MNSEQWYLFTETVIHKYSNKQIVGSGEKKISELIEHYLYKFKSSYHVDMR